MWDLFCFVSICMKCYLPCRTVPVFRYVPVITFLKSVYLKIVNLCFRLHSPQKILILFSYSFPHHLPLKKPTKFTLPYVSLCICNISPTRFLFYYFMIFVTLLVNCNLSWPAWHRNEQITCANTEEKKP